MKDNNGFRVVPVAKKLFKKSAVVMPGKLTLPFMRTGWDRTGRRWPRLEVAADSMRIGKTTAVNVIADELRKKGLNLTLGEEEWWENVYLKDSYDAGDPKQLSRFLLKSQRWFAKRKHELLRRKMSHVIYLQDVSPEMDYCYALTNLVLKRMNKKDFSEYIEFYCFLNWAKVPIPDLLVYLTASDEILVNRARRSARDFEEVDEEYFLTMKLVNQTWLGVAQKEQNVLVVDTDRFNFALNQRTKAKLGEMVIKELEDLGWNMSINRV